jgi:hypothetical protein
MQIFYVVAEMFDNPRHRLSAFVVADDETEAKGLMTADHRFDGYRMPPIELSADAEHHPAAGKAFAQLGISKLDKGVFAVTEIEPSGRPPD